jgi:hypothetical protein
VRDGLHGDGRVSKVFYLYFGVLGGLFLSLPVESFNRHEAFFLGVGWAITLCCIVAGLAWLSVWKRERRRRYNRSGRRMF